jgi:hypothetical protein
VGVDLMWSDWLDRSKVNIEDWYNMDW